MAKITIMYEYADNLYRIQHCRPKQGHIKPEKSVTVKTTLPDGRKPNYKLFRKKNVLGLVPPLDLFDFGWEHVPIYLASYKSSYLLDWGTVSSSPSMDPALYKKLREEDLALELLTPSRNRADQLMMLILGALVGFFAGVAFGPQLMGMVGG